MAVIHPFPTSGFYAFVENLCNELGAPDPFDALGVWMNESGVSPVAWNRNGHASGFFQAMPDTLRGMGFTGANGYTESSGGYRRAFLARELCKKTGDKEAQAKAQGVMDSLNSALAASFRTLDILEQGQWARRYYRTHKGKLVSKASWYTATFLPADVGLAGDPDALLVDVHGRRAWAYAPNSGFDHNRDGKITVRELEEQIEIACVGSRWGVIRDGMRQWLGLQPIGPSPSPEHPQVTRTRAIQKALNVSGANLVEDGIAGPATRDALKIFQRGHGLKADGIPGPLTRKALGLPAV